MLGKDHCLSGCAAFAAAGPLALHLTTAQLLTGVVLTGGAALLPDFDEPGSTIAREAGFLGRGFARVVRFTARGHRKGTHSLLGASLFTFSAWGAVALVNHHFTGWEAVAGRAWLTLWLALLITSALQALPLVRGHVPDIAGIGAAIGLTFWHQGLTLVPACVGLGVLVHIAGDMLTIHGCPLFFPFWKRDFHDSPLPFSTGKFTEHYLIGPALILGLFVALACDTGTASYVLAHR